MGVNVSIPRSYLAAACVLVAGALVASAPSVASGAGPLGEGAMPFSSVSGATPPAASADTSDCADRAATSNFHEAQGSDTFLPAVQLPSDAVSVPTWSESFTTDGTNYPYTMVGTDPAAGSVSTHVPVEIIPLTLDFQSDGCVLEHPGMATNLEASPLFSNAQYRSGEVSQQLDAMQRENFWSTVTTVSTDWHLLLDPIDIPTVTLHVPASQGLTIPDPYTGGIDGIVSDVWLLRQIEGLLGSLHISPTTLAAFVPYNTFVTDQDPEDCLVSCAYFTGYHYAFPRGKTPHTINTFAMASYLDLGTATPPGVDFSAYVLSHEILEWANDPFDYGTRVKGEPTYVSNYTPPWTSPYYAEGTICSPVLEVADPLEAWYLLKQPISSPTTYAIADEAFLPWFTRQTPSTSYSGLYDAAGIFNTYSTAC
jgi:hypothetical protein